MNNLDQLLSYLVFITVITFIFERMLENLFIPLLPISSQDDASENPESKGLSLRTYLTLFLIFAIGLGLALSNPKFRLLAAGLGMDAAPLIDSIFTAALMAGGSQPLHSMINQVRKK